MTGCIKTYLITGGAASETSNPDWQLAASAAVTNFTKPRDWRPSTFTYHSCPVLSVLIISPKWTGQTGGGGDAVYLVSDSQFAGHCLVLRLLKTREDGFHVNVSSVSFRLNRSAAKTAGNTAVAFSQRGRRGGWWGTKWNLFTINYFSGTLVPLLGTPWVELLLLSTSCDQNATGEGGGPLLEYD